MLSIQIAIVALLNIFTFCVSSDFNKGSTEVLPRSIAFNFSRRKRSLLLPNYGSIKLTTGITKAIVSNAPKGLSLSWEISTYYAGPTSIKDWHAKHDPSKDTPKEPQKKYGTKNFYHQNRLTSSDPYITYRNSSAIFGHRPRRWVSTFASKQDDPNEKSYHKILKISKATNEKEEKDQANSSLLGTNFMCSVLKAFCKRQEFFLPPGYSMIQDIVKIMFLESKKRHEYEDEGRSSTDFCNDFVRSHLCYNRNSFNFLDKLLNL